MSNATKTVLFGLFLLFYYVTVLGLPAVIVGAVTAVAIVADALLEPWIGQLSDHTRSAFGRRHGFMLLGALTGGVTFWLLFSPPPGLSTLALSAWLFVFSIAVRFANAMFIVPYYALGAELSRDYDGRTAITAARGACALVGTVAVAGASFVLFFPNHGSVGLDPKLNASAYPWMGLTFGMTMAVCALIATGSTLRLRSSAASTSENQARLPLHRAFAMAMRTSSFRRLFLAAGLAFLSTSLNAVLAVHFLTYYVGITSSAALSALQVAFYGAGLAGVILWVRVGRHQEKRTICVLTFAATAVLLAGAWLLFGPGHFFGTGNALPLIAGEALAGLVTSAFVVIPYSMLADVADEDELHCGDRREGLFVGVFRSGQQLGAAVSVLATGVLVETFAGLVPGQAQQTPQTVERIGLLASVLPAGLLIPAVILLLGYPLTRDRVAAIQRRLTRLSDAATLAAD